MNRKKFYTALVFLAVLILFFFLSAGFSSLDMDNALLSPSRENLFGTDSYGRSLLSRLSLGALISISLSALITALSAILGTALAFLMARVSASWVLSDSLKSLNAVILALFLSSVFSAGFGVLILSISLTHIPSVARVAYSRILSIRREEFVLYAKSEGMGGFSIARFHIVPHLRDEILIQSISIFSSSVITEATLSFLGAGIPVKYPSIGSILAEGRAVALSHPHLIVIPSLVLFLITLSLYVMQSALDPDS